jgi:hypothetical protein
VQIFGSDFQLVGIIKGFSTPYGIEADGSGRLYVSSEGTRNITVLTTPDLGDHEGPLITNIQINPINPIGTQPFTVTAMITDPSGVHNATLTYTAAGATSTVLFTPVNGSYTGDMPSFPVGTLVTFTIWAEDNSLAHHNTTSATVQINIGSAPLIPGIDTSYLAIGGLGLGIVGIVIALLALKRKPKPKKRRKRKQS